MICFGYTLKHGGHVRVDIFYSRFPQRKKAWVNAVGHIVFLIPLCIFIGFISWDFVSNSWATREISGDSGGLPFLYVLKSVIPAMAITLGLQAISETLKAVLYLIGYTESFQSEIDND